MCVLYQNHTIKYFICNWQKCLQQWEITFVTPIKKVRRTTTSLQTVTIQLHLKCSFLLSRSLGGLWRVPWGLTSPLLVLVAPATAALVRGGGGSISMGRGPALVRGGTSLTLRWTAFVRWGASMATTATITITVTVTVTARFGWGAGVPKSS